MRYVQPVGHLLYKRALTELILDLHKQIILLLNEEEGEAGTADTGS